MQPSVAAILDKILPGGNFWKWYQSQRKQLDAHGNIQEHDLIDNWTSEHFERALLSSHLYKESDYAAIRKKIDALKCNPFPSIADLESHVADSTRRI
jgi:hypothetical protein